MANLGIAANKGTFTLSFDQYDWQSVVVAGKPYNTFPLTIDVTSGVPFKAVYATLGNVPVPQWPMLIQGTGGHAEGWMALISFTKQDNTIVAEGNFMYYGAAVQVGPATDPLGQPKPLLFSSSNLTGEFYVSAQ